MRRPFLVGVFLFGTSFAAHADIRVGVAEDVRGATSVARYIERLGERLLKPGQDVRIEILDYKESRDRDPFLYRSYRSYGARRYGYWHDPFFGFDSFGNRDPGRLKVSYSLKEKGRIILADTETITNWGDRFGSPYGVSDDLGEVRRWFRQRFVQRKLRKS